MRAYFVLFPGSRVILMFPVLIFPFFFELLAVFYLGFWALSQVFSGLLSLAAPGGVGRTASWAHVGASPPGSCSSSSSSGGGRAYRASARDEY